MNLLLSYKLFLSFLNHAKKKKRKQSESYSQEEEVLYYVTPKYKKVLPSNKEEKRSQPKSIWWRTVMKELEEMGLANMEQSTGQSSGKAYMLRFDCHLLSQLGCRGLVSVRVSDSLKE